MQGVWSNRYKSCVVEKKKKDLALQGSFIKQYLSPGVRDIGGALIRSILKLGRAS